MVKAKFFAALQQNRGYAPVYHQVLHGDVSSTLLPNIYCDIDHLNASCTLVTHHYKKFAVPMYMYVSEG
jgi:hypothetical protein